MSSVSQVINFVDIFWFSFYVISVCDEEACPEDNKKCIVNEVGEPKCLCNEGYDKTLTLEEQVSEANQRICVLEVQLQKLLQDFFPKGKPKYYFKTLKYYFSCSNGC